LTAKIGLSQHRGPALVQDGIPCIVNHLIRHIRIPNAGLSRLHVLGRNGYALRRHFKAVLISAKIRPLFVDNF